MGRVGAGVHARTTALCQRRVAGERAFAGATDGRGSGRGSWAGGATGATVAGVGLKVDTSSITERIALVADEPASAAGAGGSGVSWCGTRLATAPTVVDVRGEVVACGVAVCETLLA